ncbi:MAG: UDP-N-acetylmuramate dehydrogenase [Bacteroidales bacterium]|nr:UDP-N-acetylmuramate dehydrogenase [Lentimicrobiaceae bacterium]MDD5695351.1 UDP-N-acetylmuramate dehydrogenase [Bacteroidales bacterium]
MIRKNISLKNYNTFGIDVNAAYFASVQAAEEVEELLTHDEVALSAPLLILGGGSNILFTRDFAGLVIKMESAGIDLLRETPDHAEIRVHAGQNWDQLVGHCVGKGLGGLENLSLIPGTAGAAPIQNIGAYGAELKDVLTELCAWDRQNKQIVSLPAQACGFGYRTSIFKTTAKDRYIILSITLRLAKRPSFNLRYGALEEEIRRTGVRRLSLKTVREAVINIRRRKLPDPELIGNAGSFFKNPEVPAADFLSLKKSFPGLPGNFQDNGAVKLAAGWMIEHCGWKGFREGRAGVHQEQALVLVNLGNACGEEILQLAEKIKHSVAEEFGVMLETEVNIL